jgi:hypothetical protein
MRERPMSDTIFGMLNTGFGLLGLIGVLLSNTMSGMLEGPGAAAAGSPLGSISAFIADLYHSPAYVLWNRITVPLNFAASLLMVAAGVGLLLLKNWARLASIGCGIYKILFVLLNIAVLCRGLREIGANVMDAAGPVGIVILAMISLVATLFSLAYPVLLLYFLTRPKAVQAFQPEPPSPL